MAVALRKKMGLIICVHNYEMYRSILIMKNLQFSCMNYASFDQITGVLIYSALYDIYRSPCEQI